MSVATIIQHAMLMHRIITICGVRLNHIFPQYLTNGTIFGKTLLKMKCVFRFPLQLLSKTYVIVRRNVHWSSCKVPVILVRFEFSRQIFEKYSNIKFHENPSSWSRAVPRGRTDTTKQITAFRNFANAPKKTYVVQDSLIY
jgi:hypothetical protein